MRNESALPESHQVFGPPVRYAKLVAGFIIGFFLLADHSTAENLDGDQEIDDVQAIVKSLDETRASLPREMILSFLSDPVKSDDFVLQRRSGSVSHQSDPSQRDAGFTMTQFAEQGTTHIDLSCRISPVGDFDVIAEFSGLEAIPTDTVSVFLGLGYFEGGHSVQFRSLFRSENGLGPVLIGQFHEQELPEKPVQFGKAHTTTAREGEFRVARRGTTVTLLHRSSVDENFSILDQHRLPVLSVRPTINLRVAGRNAGAVRVTWKKLRIAAESFATAPWL